MGGGVRGAAQRRKTLPPTAVSLRNILSPPKAQHTSQPYLFRGIKQRSLFLVTSTFLGESVIRAEEMLGTSGRK